MIPLHIANVADTMGGWGIFLFAVSFTIFGIYDRIKDRTRTVGIEPQYAESPDPSRRGPPEPEIKIRDSSIIKR